MTNKSRLVVVFSIFHYTYQLGERKKRERRERKKREEKEEKARKNSAIPPNRASPTRSDFGIVTREVSATFLHLQFVVLSHF